MASVCLLLSTWLLLPAVHEVHAYQADKGYGTMYPFEVDDAVVTGVASSAHQAAFDADLPPPGWGSIGPHAYAMPQRSLLHGNRKPWNYSVCNRCTIVSCSGSKCSGHCKKNKTLYFCKTRRGVADFRCTPPKPKELPDLSVDYLGDYDSAVVTAPAPFIGCAQIAGKTSTGCPERLTRAPLPGGGRVIVLESKCMAERYLPECPGPTPLYPFGICECRVIVTRPKLHIEHGPCNFTQLSGDTGTITLPRRLGAAAEPEAIVQSDGNVTTTGFVDYIEDGEEPEFVVTRDVESDAGDVALKLEIFQVDTMVVNPDNDYSVLEEEEDFAEEYEEVYGEDPDTGGGDDDSDSSPDSAGVVSSTTSTTSSSTTSVVRAGASATASVVNTTV